MASLVKEVEETILKCHRLFVGLSLYQAIDCYIKEGNSPNYISCKINFLGLLSEWEGSVDGNLLLILVLVDEKCRKEAISLSFIWTKIQ